MLACINKNSVEYQALVSRAGIPEVIVEAYSRNFLEKYGRFPYLDELPNVNSENSLRDNLKVRKNDSSKISNILEYTGTDTVEDAIITINDLYRDLETNIIPINEDAIVDILHRPTINNFDVLEVTQDANVDSYQVINTALNRLINLYGIKINTITDAELSTDKWSKLVPDSGVVNAFVYNGLIYVNLDHASVDAPIHEMFHIFVGSLRFTNPKMYLEIIDSIEKLPNYNILRLNYIGRSRNDVNEEIFVSEVAKYLSGTPTIIEGLDSKLRYEITYNIKRVLDSMIMGQDSVKTIEDTLLFNMSLKEIATVVNSAVMVNNFHGTMNVEGSELHRRLNNVKADLLENGTLKELCD